MTQQLYDLEYVEQQVAELRLRLDRMFKILEQIEEIPDRFLGLAAERDRINTLWSTIQTGWPSLEADARATIQESQTSKMALEAIFKEREEAHERRIDKLEQATEDTWAELRTAVTSAIETLNARSIELEKVNDQRWVDFREELVNVQNQLYTAHRNLRVEIESQLNGFKGEIEERLAALRSDWNRENQSIIARLDELALLIRTESESNSRQLNELRNETGKRVSSIEDSIQRLEQTFHLFRYALIASIALGTPALLIAIWALIQG